MCCASAPTVRSGMSVRLSVRLSVLSACLAACVSALNLHDETFRYQVLNSRRFEGCSMCFGDECWDLESDRCKYYSEVNEILSRSEADGGPGDVDILVHDMVEQVAASWSTLECIPLVSQHTDCNKENICVGCQSCTCDAFGKWNCKEMQQCRADPDLDVDHKVLVAVAAALRDNRTLRNKRSTENKTDTAAPRKISFAEISEWFYGVKPTHVNSGKNDRKNNEIHTKITSTTEKDKTGSSETETDYIEFDEVLKNIAIDNENHKKLKSQPNETNFEFNDYMILDETVVVKNNETNQFVNMLNAIVDGNENTTIEPIVEETTKIVIDLLTSLKNNEKLNVTSTSNIDLSSNIIKEDYYADDIIFDAINIMKRDVSSDLLFNLTTEANTRNSTNTTKPVTELKYNVLIPLTKIIDDKEQELKDLIKIKDNLIQFMKDYNDSDSDLDVKKQEVINNTNTVLSIYNLDIFPEIQFNLRKINPNSLDKLLYKLKRDIYEVIKDVISIKKLSKTNNLPDDLKSLVRAMGVYVRKQGNVTSIVQNGIKLKNDINQRRQLTDDSDELNSTKDYLIKILEILDKDTPQTEALSFLSPTTRRIVKRVIKNYYFDDFSAIGLSAFDPEYNLTNDLRNVGNKWKLMTAKVAASAPADKIYAMKLLHLTLSVDISKMNDVLALIDFAHSRRMIPIEGRLGEKLLDKINHGLNAINDKIKIIMKYKASRAILGRSRDTTIKPSKRKSFLKKIRNLLSGSKKEIVELVNQNVPRSQIVKTIAKKRLNDLARKRVDEYEDVMRKWQSTLNVIPRNKRSLDLSRIQNRMNNIIPKYLRGKLNPAIEAKKNKKTRNTQNEATLKRPTNTKQRKIATGAVKTKIIPAKPKTVPAKPKTALSKKQSGNRRTKAIPLRINKTHASRTFSKSKRH